MEIIFSGIPPAEKQYEATCNTCKSALKFKQSEGWIAHDRNGDFITVICPVCNTPVCKEL